MNERRDPTPVAVFWEPEEIEVPERIALYDHQVDGGAASFERRDYTTDLISIAAETCTSMGADARPIDGQCQTIELSETQARWLAAEITRLLGRREQAKRAKRARARKGAAA